jgi:hypothetical protein
MRPAVVIVLAAGLALTACGEPQPAGGALPPPSDVTIPPTTGADPALSDGPFDPAAENRPDLMIVEPSAARPGELVAVWYPGGRERGVAYALERRDGDRWDVTHLLTATTDSYGSSPSWVPFGSEGYGWEDIGISGPGPDVLVVPDSAVPGDHRICTANSLENICVEIVVDERLPLGPGTAGPLVGLLGLPLDEFEAGVVGLGYGPVRVGWRDGESLAVTEDLQPGRVTVAVENRDDVDVVVDARIEADTETGVLGPDATAPTEVPVVGVYEGVSFYPACGDESLEHDGVRWYQVQDSDYPDVYARVVDTPRERAPGGAGIRGFALRVVEPGPGDDVGTLVVWADGVAHFTSDSGDLTAWLVDEELTYRWTC